MPLYLKKMRKYGLIDRRIKKHNKKATIESKAYQRNK